MKIYFESGMLILSGIYLYMATGFPMGKITQPGAGFFPVIVGLLAVLVSAALLLKTFLTYQNEKKAGKSFPLSINAGDAKKMAAYLATLIVFINVFEKAGSLISIFFLALILTKLYRMPGWVKPVILSAITSGLIFIVFTMWFKIPLPGIGQ